MKRSRQNKDLRLREKPRKKLHSNDALTGTKTWNKKPSETKNKPGTYSTIESSVSSPED